MNDIQRQFLLIIGMLALSCLGLLKLAEIVLLLLKQLDVYSGLIFFAFFVALIFKLRFDAYKRKGGE